MEVFYGAGFMRLRSWEYESYHIADEDGRSVNHDSHRGASRNAVWAVQLLASGEPHAQYALFRGAYGRYLRAWAGASTERFWGCCPLDSSRPRSATATRRRPTPSFRCGPDVIADPGANGVVLLHDRSWRYLRANERFLSCYRSVSVDGLLNDDKTLRWEVVPVPATPDRPELPIAIDDSCWDNLFSPLQREIRFVTAGDEGNFSMEESWHSFQFTGRSVDNLRGEFRDRLCDNFTMCVRAGEYGYLTSLLIDLPRSQETLRIVLVRPNSADGQFVFPDLNTLSPAGSEEGRRMID